MEPGLRLPITKFTSEPNPIITTFSLDWLNEYYPESLSSVSTSSVMPLWISDINKHIGKILNEMYFTIKQFSQRFVKYMRKVMSAAMVQTHIKCISRNFNRYM